MQATTYLLYHLSMPDMVVVQYFIIVQIAMVLNQLSVSATPLNTHLEQAVTIFTM